MFILDGLMICVLLNFQKKSAKIINLKLTLEKIEVKML